MSEIFCNCYIDASDTEPEEHRLLRKTFMEVHKNKYPEEYLVALSKAFVNIKYLGCVYSAPIMARITELSTDVITQHRQSKLGKGTNYKMQSRWIKKQTVAAYSFLYFYF